MRCLSLAVASLIGLSSSLALASVIRCTLESNELTADIIQSPTDRDTGALVLTMGGMLHARHEIARFLGIRLQHEPEVLRVAVDVARNHSLIIDPLSVVIDDATLANTRNIELAIAFRDTDAGVTSFDGYLNLTDRALTRHVGETDCHLNSTEVSTP